MNSNLSHEFQNVKLNVKGSFPNWLKGTFVRNGPVNTFVNGISNSHWFDGLAKLHAFTFSSDGLFYSSTFLKTDAYNCVKEDHSLNYTGFAVDPCRALFKSFFTHHLSPNANVNVSKIADDYVALTEIPLPIRFDLKTTQTIGPLSFGDQLPQSGCWESAHPHVLEEESYNYLVDIGLNSDYVITKLLKGSNRRELVAKVRVKHPSYMHSFSLTENKIILSEYPFRLSPIPLILRLKPFIYNYHWHSEEKALFNVIDKKSGQVDIYEADPFFSFHHVNAYEEEERIIFDAIAYEDATVVTSALFNLHEKKVLCPSKVEGHYRRYILKDGKAEFKRIYQPSVEFPRINPRFDGKRHRYAYVADFEIDPNDNQKSLHAKGLIKYDLGEKSQMLWSESNSYPGEPVFIPNPNGKNEDDGLIVTIALSNQQPYLLILEASSFSEIGRAYVEAPIELGLHGQFFFN